MSSARNVLGTFVAVFVLIVGTVSVGGLIVHDDRPGPAEVDKDHWDPDTIVPEQAPDGGEIAMESTESNKTIVVYTGSSAAMGGAGGGQPLPISDDGPGHELSVGSLGGASRDVSPLVSVLVENGHEVVFYDGPTSQQRLDPILSDADAFVTVGSATFTATERDSIERFVDDGGRTVIAASPGSTADTAEIASTAGLATDPGYLYDLEENDNNHLGVYAEPTGDSPLTDGVDRIVLRGASPVRVSGGEPALETLETTTLSTTRESGSYVVAAHSGDMAVIGDSSFLEPENAHRVDNDVLVGNVADFLVTGEKAETNGSEGSAAGGPTAGSPTQSR